MANQIFQPGNVVQLKSGSPKMMVEKSGTEWTNCFFYNDKSGKFETQNISTTFLQLVDTNDPVNNES